MFTDNPSPIMSSTRSTPFAFVVPAWMIVVAAPAPLIVSEPVISRSPEAAASS